MLGTWDSHLKLLMAHSAQDYVSWLVAGAIVEEELSPHFQRHVDADILYSIRIADSKYAIHIEFQTRHDTAMARRLWEYNVLASCKFDRPIYSIVIFLKKDYVATVSPYIVRDHEGSEIHRFQFGMIKLWELPTQSLFKQGFRGLLPLAPLTREGQRREVVDAMIAGLTAGAVDKELLSLSYGLAGLAFENKQDDLAWLKWRYRMLDEILEESWTWQDFKKRAEDQGRQVAEEKAMQKATQKAQAELQKALAELREKVQAELQEKVQAELQLQQEKVQAELQLQQQKAQAELQLQQQKAQAELQLQQQKAQAELQLQQQKVQTELQLQQQKAQAELLLSFVQARFPALIQLAKECGQSIVSPAVMQNLILQVGLAQTEEEAHRFLLAALPQ